LQMVSQVYAMTKIKHAHARTHAHTRAHTHTHTHTHTRAMSSSCKGQHRTVQVVLCEVEVQHVAIAAHDAVPAVGTGVPNKPVVVLGPLWSVGRVVQRHERVSL
jgi:hypothetical protein